jgi:hypothetical protein
MQTAVCSREYFKRTFPEQMSVAFSPAALGFGHTVSTAGASVGPGTAGGLRVPGLSRHVQPPNQQDAQAAQESVSRAQAANAAIDRRVRQLLDASAAVFFSASEAMSGPTVVAPAPVDSAQQVLGTPSLTDRAVTPSSMLSNYAESASSRDLLLQTLSDRDRRQLRELHARWRTTAQRSHRTSHGVLFVCLQPGGDPPEHPRISPRAKLEAWIDASEETAKIVRRGSEAVIEALELQYKSLYRDVVFRRCNEATIDDARAALQQMRRKAESGGRLLIHYNGHGMPSATQNGELWFFDARREHFVPFNIVDIAAFAESPAVYVLDCNCAAHALNMWRQSIDPAQRENSRDVFLCACAEDQVLPSNPVLPADFFTACLTTPLRAALVWYAHYSDRQPLLPSVDPGVIEQIPGDENNKKSPRGELAFILSAVADTVAWCTVDPLQFYALFRQDMMLRTLLRNFLIADRLMRETGCTPRSHPPLPYHAHLHPAWQAWDVALEGVLAQVPGLLRAPTTQKYTPSPFWRDQLSSFEVGLAVGTSSAYAVPEQLPCVVLALGQTSYRCRALILLTRYFELGTRAVHHGLACGVIGYMVRLLANREHAMLLLCLWFHTLRANPEVACAELVRAGAEALLVWMLNLSDTQCRLRPVRNTLEDLPGPTPYLLSSTATGPPGPNAAAAAAGAATSVTGQVPAGASRTTSGTRTNLTSGSAGATAANQMAPNISVQPPFMGYHGSQEGTTASSPHAVDTRVSPQPAIGQPQATVYIAPAGLTLGNARTIAAFLLCSMVNAGAERTAVACWNAGMVNSALRLTADLSEDMDTVNWGCLLLGRICEFLPIARQRLIIAMAYHRHLFVNILQARHPAVRASCVNLLGKILCADIAQHTGEDRDRALDVMSSILRGMLHELHGVSTDVRAEISISLLGFIYTHRAACDPDVYEALLKGVTTGEFINPDDKSKTTSETVQFRVLETWRRATVHSRLAASAVPASGPLGAEDAGGVAAVQIECESLPVPSRQPQPPTPAEPLAKHHQSKLADLVHDAVIMAHAAARSPDSRLRAVTLDALRLMADKANPQCPLSNRVAREGHRLALSMDREAQHTVSDQERCSERRNQDLMRQSLLRAEDTTSILGRVGQQTQTQQQPGGALSAAQPSPVGGALGAPTMSGVSPFASHGPGAMNLSAAAAGINPGNASPRSPHSPSFDDAALARARAALMAPNLHSRDMTVINSSADSIVTALALRELEPQLISIDQNRHLTVTHYEKLRSPSTIDYVTLPPSLGAVAQLHVVNDLSSSPMALCVGSTGSCVLLHIQTDPHNVVNSPNSPTDTHSARIADPFLTFYGSCASALGSATATESATAASALSSLLPLPVQGGVTSAYRSRDGVLFFGGVPNQIRCFSLSQEMLEQVLSVPGTGIVTALHNTVSNELYAGMDDGTVKIFDTRQHSGYWSFAAALGDTTGLGRQSRVTPRVIHVSRSEAAPNDVLVAYKTCIKVYDARRRGQPKYTVEIAASEAPSQLLSAFGVCKHLPLMISTTADGAMDAMSLKGTPICDDAIRVAPVAISHPALQTPHASERHLAPAPPTPHENSHSIVGGAWNMGHVMAVHPHRPIVAVGKTMIVFTPDDARLATSLAI